MKMSRVFLVLIAVTLSLPASSQLRELEAACDDYPYPEGMFVREINGETTYIYTLLGKQNRHVKENYSFAKLRASRIAIGRLTDYIYNKFKNELDFREQKISGVFPLSECSNHAEKKYYTSYAWSQMSYGISQGIQLSR